MVSVITPDEHGQLKSKPRVLSISEKAYLYLKAMMKDFISMRTSNHPSKMN